MNIPLTPIRFLRYAREQFPNRTGVVCGPERFTYAQFGERAARQAGALIAAGVKHGDRIAFLSTNCHRLLEAYYGVLEAGCILLPLNIRLSPQDLAFVLKDAQAKFLFLEQQFLPLVEAFRLTVPSIECFFLLDGAPQANWLAPQNYEDLLAAAQPFQCDFMQIDEDSVAELFYTSGTSDRPKGVMLTHRNVYLHALSTIVAGQTNPTMMGLSSCEAVALHTIPLFHANGWGAAHTITVVGGKHVMIHHFIPAEVFRLIEKERVRSCCLVPTMATALINSPERQKFDLSSLRAINIGGAASSPTLVREVEEKLGCACFSGYGLTETAPTLTISPMKPGLSWTGEQRYKGAAMTGFAIPGVEIRVVDGNGKDVPHDGATIGEVIARGDVVMDGYWGQPEVTAAAMEGGWFHTGDVATIDQDNYVQIVDRKKDIIVSGGENISSLEVEKVLAAHPNVYEAIVFAVPDRKWGEVPKALVVLKPGSATTEAELLEFCRSHLSHYKCPHSIDFLDSLPKTGTGKLLKRELRKKYWAAEKSTVSQS
ncbi:MAG TPA: long-chain-fatty-acid--CoA ligase [Terriglobales bacterium]|jgi:fatty-acyl-CoA synthase|nr:long-chain-fatty-acid--CoA ligase [Terriglobales bacterium]